MKLEIELIISDAWETLYINGELVLQEGSIASNDMLEVLAHHLHEHIDVDIDYED